MRAYGLRPGQWRDVEGGPPSRWAKLSAKQRKESRRLLHKQARNDAKRETTA